MHYRSVFIGLRYDGVKCRCTEGQRSRKAYANWNRAAYKFVHARMYKRTSGMLAIPLLARSRKHRHRVAVLIAVGVVMNIIRTNRVGGEDPPITVLPSPHDPLFVV